ncbi:MAG: L,D-transpeptidase family protein, partial [Chloroflexota bacterium]
LGNRLLVYVPGTKNYAYVDAAVLKPSPLPLGTVAQNATTPTSVTNPPAPQAPPAPPALGPAAPTSTFAPWWVQSFQPVHLWSGPADPAADYGAVPQWSFLQVVTPQAGPRLYVYVPWTKNYAYVDATGVGPSGPPPPDWVTSFLSSWTGTVIADSLIERAAPSTSAAVVKTLPTGSPVSVVAWVNGDEVVPGDWTWAQLSDGNYCYTEGMQIFPPTAAPLPPDAHPSGKWIDVSLLRQTVVAYQDNTPVYLAIASTGSPGWETPPGTHLISRRVANETMKGSTLTSLGLDALQLARTHYDLQNVLYTQYFDGSGDALHDNYWLPDHEFGVPHSHGCVGLRLADAKWFWDWADYGVPVVVRAR